MSCYRVTSAPSDSLMRAQPIEKAWRQWRSSSQVCVPELCIRVSIVDLGINCGFVCVNCASCGPARAKASSRLSELCEPCGRKAHCRSREAHLRLYLRDTLRDLDWPVPFDLGYQRSTPRSSPTQPDDPARRNFPEPQKEPPRRATHSAQPFSATLRGAGLGVGAIQRAARTVFAAPGLCVGVYRSRAGLTLVDRLRIMCFLLRSRCVSWLAASVVSR